MEVVLPWRDSGDADRRAHFWRLREWYERGGFNVVVGDSDPAKPFNRAGARNNGIFERSTTPVVAVVDADNLIPPVQLHWAFREALVGQRRLVKPFTWFGYLDATTTDAWYAGDLPDLEVPGQSPLGPDAGVGYEGAGPQRGFTGGAYVMRRTAWLETGGFDEEFTGWGGEDDAFTLLAKHRLGPVEVVPGTAYHLWHPSPGRMTSPENYQRLMSQYVARLGG